MDLNHDAHIDLILNCNYIHYPYGSTYQIIIYLPKAYTTTTGTKSVGTQVLGTWSQYKVPHYALSARALGWKMWRFQAPIFAPIHCSLCQGTPQTRPPNSRKPACPLLSDLFQLQTPNPNPLNPKDSSLSPNS